MAEKAFVSADMRSALDYQEAMDGDRCFKIDRADIRTKVTVIAGNADRYPISVRCEMRGVSRSTCYSIAGGEGCELEADAVRIFSDNRIRRYSALGYMGPVEFRKTGLSL